MLLLLALIFLLLTIITYILFDYDFTSPSVLFVVAYFFGAVSALNWEERWHINLSSETIGILVSGAVLFIVVCYFCGRIIKKNNIKIDCIEDGLLSYTPDHNNTNHLLFQK